MADFYTNLKQNLGNHEFLKENINSFNDLDDEEVKLLFDDEEIERSLKTAIAELCYERINTLPFSIFSDTLLYMDNPYLFVSNYKRRIENLSYEELVFIISEAYLEPDCVIEITKMDVFAKYLEQETENKNGTILQSFKLSTELYLNQDSIDKLEVLGKKIIDLLQSSSDYSEYLEMLIDLYVRKVIENNKEISLNGEINSIGIEIMNYYLKNHKLLSNELIQFYILFRLKDLKLDVLCNQVIVSSENSSTFGGYQPSSGTLEIFSKYMIQRFEPLFKEYNLNDEKANAEFLNLMLLMSISHELGHIAIFKNVEEFQKAANTYEAFEAFQSNESLYYYYKNEILKLFLGYEKYYQFHDNFIEENRCDIFSIFDSSIQIEKYFKGSFSLEMLQIFCLNNASRILGFYTQKNDNNEVVIKTPMQKFDEFFNSYLPNQEKEIHLSITNSSDSIMNNLMLGGEIPDYVLEGISKIAKGEIVSTSIYSSLMAIINEAQTFTIEEDVGIKK